MRAKGRVVQRVEVRDAGVLHGVSARRLRDALEGRPVHQGGAAREVAARPHRRQPHPRAALRHDRPAGLRPPRRAGRAPRRHPVHRRGRPSAPLPRPAQTPGAVLADDPCVDRPLHHQGARDCAPPAGRATYRGRTLSPVHPHTAHPARSPPTGSRRATAGSPATATPPRRPPAVVPSLPAGSWCPAKRRGMSPVRVRDFPSWVSWKMEREEEDGRLGDKESAGPLSQRASAPTTWVYRPRSQATRAETFRRTPVQPPARFLGVKTDVRCR